ncbi:MAG: SDR family oxidoreductase [Myxococcales bacterium FL481]|nr:MAG: SDR family oxidoreductase [Myxococcales bacterium FL481]
MADELRDKVVVITGAGSGVGRGLVAGFCRDGAQVVGISRTEADLADTQRDHGVGRMEYVVGDVSNASDIERLFSLAEERHGRVDVLVNNAAVYPKVRFLDQHPDDFEKALLINVMGVARTCHRALPGMLERGFGRIVNIGSFAFKGVIPLASLYSASKGAVSPLTQGIAVEIDRDRHPDVLVNELMPGIFRTRMTPDQGADPMTAYPHVRNVVLQPAGGPHGRIFLLGDLWEEYGSGGRKAQLKRLLRRLLP